MEIWDIYDENMNKTGKTMERDNWSMQPGEYHVSVLGVVQRPDKKYLITQRKMDKPWGAGWWEFPGGAVRAGEEPEAAVRREVAEETGLDVSDVAAEKVLTYKREDPNDDNNYFMSSTGSSLTPTSLWSRFRKRRSRTSRLPMWLESGPWQTRASSSTTTALVPFSSRAITSCRKPIRS